MRPILRTVFRLLVGTSTFVAVAVPTLLVLGWALVYLASLVEHLSAPGVPLEVEYETATSRAKLTAQSYAISWDADAREWRFLGFGLEVRSPRGQVVAQLDRLDAAGNWPATQVRVAASHAQITLIRQADRKFNLESLLPKPQEEGPQAWIDLRAKNIRLKYRDETARPALEEHLSVSEVRAKFVGATSSAQVDLAIDGVGRIPLDITSLRSGPVLVSGRLDQAELRRGWDQARRWIDPVTLRDWGKIETNSLRASGPFWVRWRSGDFEAAGQFDWRAEGLQVQDVLQGARVQGKTLLTQKGASGSLASLEPGRKAEFRGEIRWDGPLRLAGGLRAQLRSGAQAWNPLKAVLPREVQIGRSAFKGSVALTESGWRVGGELDISEARWGDEVVSRSKWRLGLDESRVSARLMGGRWLDQPVSGEAGLEFASGKVSGAFQLAESDLATVTRRWGRPEIQGRWQAAALLGGTISKPQIDLRAEGVAQYRDDSGRAVFLGNFKGRSRMDRNRATLQRLVVSGPQGAASASGTFALDSKKLNLKISSGNLDISAIFPEVSGVAFASASITGTPAKPVVDAKAEVFGLQYGDYRIPVFSTRVQSDSERVIASEMVARTGNTQGTGWAQWNPTTGVVEGEFEAATLTLSDWLGDTVNGAARAEQVKLSGTLDSPVLTGSLRSEGVSIGGVRIEEVMADFKLTKQEAELSRAEIRQDDARADLRGTYTWQDRRYQAQGRFENADLARVLVPTEDLQVEGKASGEFKLAGTADQLTRLDSNLILQNVEVNQSLLGSGGWTVTSSNGIFRGEGALSTLGRSAVVQNAEFNSETRALRGELDFFNFDLSNIVVTADRWTRNWTEDARNLIKGAEGSVFASFLVGGTPEAISVEMSDLQVKSMEIQGRQGGDLSARGSYREGHFKMESLDWLVRPATENEAASRIRGQFSVEEGLLRGGGELTNLDLSWIQAFGYRDFPIYGNVDQLTFDLAGTTDAPEVTGSLQAQTIGLPGAEGSIQTVPANFLLDQFRLKEGQLEGTGTYFYEGFGGPFEFTGPLDAFQPPQVERVNPQPFVLRVDVRERPISELEGLLPSLDGAQSQGTVRGQGVVRIEQGVAKIEARLEAQAEQIALKNFDERLRRVTAVIEANESTARLQGRLSPSQGGELTWSLSTDLTGLISEGLSLSDALNQAQIAGEIRALALQLDQALANSQGRPEGRVTGMVQGGILVSGPLMKPSLANAGSPIRLSDGVVLLPSDFPISEGRKSFTWDPAFSNLTFEVAPETRLQSSLVNLLLRGSGTLNGQLSIPDLVTKLDVQEGSMQLPTARVLLEDTSKITLNYQGRPDGNANARVDLDLEGRTSVSARRFDSIERYDINLRIRGDLLDPQNTLSFTASSEPPDLSQDQILALIGQKEFIEGLASSVFRNRSAVQDALLGFTLQNWLSPFTRSLAGELKLDYLAVEYNPIDGFSAVAAKTFDRGWTLQFRRQITSTVGQNNDYELKLTYRPRVRSRTLERTRFGLATDSRRPWKITFEYSIRF